MAGSHIWSEAEAPESVQKNKKGKPAVSRVYCTVIDEF